MATKKEVADARVTKALVALALAQVNVDKAMAAVLAGETATPAQMKIIKAANDILTKAQKTLDEAQVAALPKALAKYHFTHIKAKGTYNIKNGKGFLRHIIYNAPLVHPSDIVLVDGQSANDSALAFDPNTVFPTATIDGTVMVPGDMPKNEKHAKYVLEYHTAFQKGLVVVLQMDRDITVVWE